MYYKVLYLKGKDGIVFKGYSLKGVSINGGGEFVNNFLRDFFFFSKFFKFQILKIFKKKSSIAQYCAIDLLIFGQIYFVTKAFFFRQKFNHNPSSDSIKLEHCDHI